MFLPKRKIGFGNIWDGYGWVIHSVLPWANCAIRLRSLRFPGLGVSARGKQKGHVAPWVKQEGTWVFYSQITGQTPERCGTDFSCLFPSNAIIVPVQLAKSDRKSLITTTRWSKTSPGTSLHLAHGQDPYLSDLLGMLKNATAEPETAMVQQRYKEYGICLESRNFKKLDGIGPF